MDWYKVIKTIKGHRYIYLQKTYRVNGRVKTINKYVGPAAASRTRSRESVQLRSSALPADPSVAKPSLSPPVVSATAPETPEDALRFLTPYRNRIEDPTSANGSKSSNGKFAKRTKPSSTVR